MADETTIYPPHKEDVIFNKPSLKEFIRLIKQGSIHEIWPTTKAEKDLWNQEGENSIRKNLEFNYRKPDSNGYYPPISTEANALTIFYGDNNDQSRGEIKEQETADQYNRIITEANALRKSLEDKYYGTLNEFGYPELRYNSITHSIDNADKWYSTTQVNKVKNIYEKVIIDFTNIYDSLKAFEFTKDYIDANGKVILEDDGFVQEYKDFFTNSTNEVNTDIASEGEYGVSTDITEVKTSYNVINGDFYNFDSVLSIIKKYLLLINDLLNLQDEINFIPSSTIIEDLQKGKTDLENIKEVLDQFLKEKTETEISIQKYIQYIKSFYLKFQLGIQEDNITPIKKLFELDNIDIGVEKDGQIIYDTYLAPLEETCEALNILVSNLQPEKELLSLEAYKADLLDEEKIDKQEIVNQFIEAYNKQLNDGTQTDPMFDPIKEKIEIAQGYIIDGFRIFITNPTLFTLSIYNSPFIIQNLYEVTDTIFIPILNLKTKQSILNENADNVSNYVQQINDKIGNIESALQGTREDWKDPNKNIIFRKAVLTNDGAVSIILKNYGKAFDYFSGNKEVTPPINPVQIEAVFHYDSDTDIKAINSDNTGLANLETMIAQINAQHTKINTYFEILKNVGFVINNTISIWDNKKDSLILRLQRVKPKVLGKPLIDKIKTDFPELFDEATIEKGTIRLSENTISYNKSTFVPKFLEDECIISNKDIVLKNLFAVIEANTSLQRVFNLNKILGNIDTKLRYLPEPIYALGDAEHYACIQIGSNVVDGEARDDALYDGKAVINIDGKDYYAAIMNLAKTFDKNKTYGNSQIPTIGWTKGYITDWSNSADFKDRIGVHGTFGDIYSAKTPGTDTTYDGWTVRDKNGAETNLKAIKLIGAVYNDYAEYRSANAEPGRCIIENGDGTLRLADARLQLGGAIVSDTFGFSIGATAEATCPIAVSGRVLAYPLEDVSLFKPGAAVCSGPDGTISLMTRAEIREWPDAIVGYVSEIPAYDTWGTDNVPVNGRIWIKIK